MSDNGNGTSIINKPTGGGAIAGMGEKFSPDLFTGTGNFSVPIAVPPGRNGFQPDITLGYSSGNGSGIFGLGWNLSIPGVARKTSKGIPLYDDDKDVFILSGAEDLVEITREPLEGGGYKASFRPRTEGLFARIERYNDATNDYWKVWSKDGLVSYYGTPGKANTFDTYNDPAVCADPQYKSKVFQWYLSKTVDVFGNVIVYTYTRENRSSTASPEDPHDFDQIYLSKIEYTDYFVGENLKFLCSVRLQYETRPDPISVYKQGFEIRTTKRVTKIETYTHAEESNTKVKTYHFDYVDKRVEAKELSTDRLPLNGVSILSQVRIEGHDGNISEWMPPLEFGYSGFEPQHRNFEPITGDDMPPVSLASRDYEMADVFGTGLPDIIQLNGVARYWRNLGDGKYDLPKMMKEIPSGAKLADPQIQLVDANGDGKLDLLYNKPGVNGYYSMKHDGLWDHKNFTRHKYTPSFSLSDPEVKLLDLDGDGITDVLRNGSRLECFLNDPVFGFYKTITTEKKKIKKFPNVSFADPRIKFADMCGDGLQDIVMIHDGNITYWPNMGYGRWGAPVTMKSSPRFPYQYNPAQILLSDVDGDGCTDLVYVENNKVTLWINQSGESWSEPIVIQGTPPLTDPNALRFTDVKGSGIAGLVWSYEYSVNPGRERMYMLDFTKGIKPYVLNEMNNHMGAITRVEYKSSTHYYLKDQHHRRAVQQPDELGVLPNGKRIPWKTTLPFPVQVVSRVEVIDELSLGKLVTEYSYHHGYWDGGEREFRGFGRVHQRDTESFNRYNESSAAEFLQVEKVHYTPPMETISWFHLGPVGAEQGDWEEVYFEDEYWSGDAQMLKRPVDMIDMIKGLPRRARRDAYRTLRGSSLRTELYALDGDPNEKKPYTVSENLQGVRLEYSYPEYSGARTQDLILPYGPDENNKQGSGYIFFSMALASRSTQWERGTDPMTSFSFTENYDEYGNPQMQIAMAVPRGKDPLTGGLLSLPKVPGATLGGNYLVTMSKTNFVHRDNELYLIGRAVKAQSYEVTNNGTMSVFVLKDQIVKEQTTNTLLSHSLTYYDGEAFTGLGYGILGNYGVPVRTETLVMKESDVTGIYNVRPIYLQNLESPGTPDWDDEDEYPEGFQEWVPLNAGYKFFEQDEHHEEGYYCETDRKKFDFQIIGPVKGLMLQSKDPLDNVTTVTYDDYKFLPVSVVDPADMETTADYDYRVMQAVEITDVNENRAQFVFSPLGFLIKTYVLGKELQDVGDTDPAKPGTLMEYDFFAFYNNRQPVFVKTTVREHHASTVGGNDDTIVSIQYSDGFGRLLQTRTQAEEVIFGDSIFGDSGLDPEGESDGDALGILNSSTAEEDLNVIVSGWQVYNNKGKLVEKYEPYYDKGFDYRPSEDFIDARSVLKFNNSGKVSFDDASQYHFGTGNFTIEAWVKFETDSYNTILDNISGTGFDFYIYDGHLYLLLVDNSSYVQATSVTGLAKNTWNHVAAVRIGNDASDFLFYINGQEVTSNPWPTPLTGGNISSDNDALKIGHHNADYFNGSMRDVRMYGRQLPADELEENFYAGIGSPPSSSASLVFYTPLNEGTGTTVWDISSYQTSGQITGGPEWMELQKSQKVQMFYDPRGHVIRTVNPDKTEQRVLFGVPKNPENPFPGNPLPTTNNYYPTPWESYSYDANDLAPLTHPSDETVPIDHHYTPSSSLMDALGRTIKTIDRNYVYDEEEEENIPEEIVMQYVYDIEGNLLQVKDPYDREVFVHEYDFSNRPLKTTHIDGGTKYVVMDCINRPLQSWDERGALIFNGYDDLSRPIKIWARDTGDDPALTPVLRQSMIYGDSAEAISDLTDEPKAFNLKGKLYKHYDEAGLTTIDSYDFKGQVFEKKRQVISNSILLAPLEEMILDGSDPADLIYGAYRVDWEVIEESDLDDKVYITSMEYNALGRVTRMFYPEDVDNERKELVTSYNRSGALTSVTMNGEPYVECVAYNARGQKILTAYGNGMMTRYQYRPDNFRLLRMKTEGYDNSINELLYEKQSGTVKQNFSYEYDLTGNIISIIDTITDCGVAGTDELVRNFEYNALYRLMSATGRETTATGTTPWTDFYRPDNNGASRAYTQIYEYDKLGNIKTLQHLATGGDFTRVFNYSEPFIDNKLASIDIGPNNYGFDYDANGNMISENADRHFIYDYADRLKAFYIQVSEEEPSQYAQYFYDATGTRVKKITRMQGGGTKTTVYIDGIFEHTIHEGSPEVIPNLTIGLWTIGTMNHTEQNILHIMNANSRVGTYRAGDKMGDTSHVIRYNLEDHLGSSTLVLNSNGSLISKEEYYPFGETSFGSYGKKRYRFCGKEKDEESGLYYYGLRYYNPWTCRFINTDPLIAKYPFYTPYQYAGNKPINFIDLDGGEEKRRSPSGQKGDTGDRIAIGKYVHEKSGETWSLTGNERGEYDDNKGFTENYLHGLGWSKVYTSGAETKPKSTGEVLGEKVKTTVDYVSNKAASIRDSTVKVLEKASDAVQSAKGNSSGEGGGSILGTTGIGVDGKIAVAAFSLKLSAELYSTSENNVGFSFNIEGTAAAFAQKKAGKGWDEIFDAMMTDPLATEAGAYVFEESNIREKTDGLEGDPKLVTEGSRTIGVGRRGITIEESYDTVSSNRKTKVGLKVGADVQALIKHFKAQGKFKDVKAKDQTSNWKLSQSGRYAGKYNSGTIRLSR